MRNKIFMIISMALIILSAMDLKESLYNLFLIGLGAICLYLSTKDYLLERRGE